MKRRNRTSFYSFLSSPFTLVGALVLFCVLARGAWSIREKAHESALRLEVAQSELARLQENHDELSARVARLSTPAGVKAQIRERYHAVEPGESVAVIVDATPSSANSASGTSTGSAGAADSQNASWWGAILWVIGL